MDMLVFLFLLPPLLIVGGIMLRSASKARPARRPAARSVPRAQVVDGERSSLGREPPEGAGYQGSRGGRIAGTAMIVAGVGIGAAIVKALADLSNDHHSKGRLLRLRGKSALPERASGDGWHDDAVPRIDHIDPLERRVLAEAWLVSARMEHASIAAFAQLSLHLTALGAPSELIERTHRAALDEIRHARRCFAIARAYGGEAWTAGPIAELAREGGGGLDLVRLAVGSLVDGCVAEGIAADVAAHGARGAEDPVVRDALAMISADEATHAELAWSVLAWCLATGGDDVRAA